MKVSLNRSSTGLSLVITTRTSMVSSALSRSNLAKNPSSRFPSLPWEEPRQLELLPVIVTEPAPRSYRIWGQVWQNVPD
ncbi:hypothetical protein T439DRAFT_328876 [Meredithblackwellia eburnea MCA 4105]